MYQISEHTIEVRNYNSTVGTVTRLHDERSAAWTVRLGSLLAHHKTVQCC